MQHTATYIFYSSLNDFLSRKNRNKSHIHSFKNSPVVKDSIEALGVPHPEVAVIKANKNMVGLDYQVKNKDTIEVFPYHYHADIKPITPLLPSKKPGFMLDVHLGGLSKYLRMAGFDTLYNSDDWGDKYIADTGGKENRIVLSRDIGLLKRSSVKFGYFVREKDSFEQFKEIINRYQLKTQFTPFTRCIRCNGEILSVEKNTILNLLEEGTKQEHDEFWQCTSCKQVYWKGTHYKKMEILINKNEF